MVNVFIICMYNCKITQLKANAIACMKINKTIFKISLAIIVAALNGCSYLPFCFFDCSNQYTYERLQQDEENECYYQKSERAMEVCRERLDKRTYEDYEIERRRTAAQQRADDAKK